MAGLVSCSPLFINRCPSGHRGARWWCGQGTMGWGGSRAAARLLALCLFLKAALPLCGASPCSSFLWPILCISLVQIPEGTCLNDLSSCRCPYGQSLASGVADQPVNGPPLDQCLSPPSREWPSRHLSPRCSESGAVTTKKEVPLSALYLGWCWA